MCPSGLCYNTLGSFMCSPCPDGFEGRNGQCVGKKPFFGLLLYNDVFSTATF